MRDASRRARWDGWDGDGLTRLCAALARHPTLRRASFSGGALGPRAAEVLAAAR